MVILTTVTTGRQLSEVYIKDKIGKNDTDVKSTVRTKRTSVDKEILASTDTNVSL